MSQYCEIETARATARAWCRGTPTTGGEDESIDLDRIVWDPEYRDEVIQTLRAAG